MAGETRKTVQMVTSEVSSHFIYTSLQHVNIHKKQEKQNANNMALTGSPLILRLIALDIFSKHTDGSVGLRYTE